MTGVAETERLVGNIRRLRRAERDPSAAQADIAAVRADLERELGRTISRARAARLLGASQTALDRWIRDGAVPVLITPGGRREIPMRVLLDLLDERDEHRLAKQPLAGFLRARRERAQRLDAKRSASDPAAPIGHELADRRGLAYHSAVADRLDDALAERARSRLERLRGEGQIDREHYEAWRRILALTLPEIRVALRADDERARQLRQAAPFAGELDDLERRELIDAID